MKVNEKGLTYTSTSVDFLYLLAVWEVIAIGNYPHACCKHMINTLGYSVGSLYFSIE